ncbi:MAG: hypothetical protein R2838_18735 [Caldilineaceae bacterium]
MAAYADDLIARMVNPFLRDGVARVARDPARKLGWTTGWWAPCVWLWT